MILNHLRHQRHDCVVAKDGWHVETRRLREPVKQVGLIQIGLGVIGRTVIVQTMAQRPVWEREFGLQLVHRALIDSSGGVACQDPCGYSDKTLARAIERRGAGEKVATFAADLGLTPRGQLEALTLAIECGWCIVIDTAIGVGTSSLVRFGLDHGHGAVLSNKASLALPLNSNDGCTLWDHAGFNGLLRYETTCGAGLPIISTLRSLLDTGDRVAEITGAVSGTFGAIFSEVDTGLPFSAAVQNAKAAGYTEPDPRDDLSGLDVARKALILARTIGLKTELEQIRVESLIPAHLAKSSVAEFMNQVSCADESIQRRSDEARANGARLKYVATIRPDSPISVGLRAIPTDTVLGSLRGPENVITIRTDRYDPYPISVTGPGAGAAVTAAGVVADLLELAKISGA